VTCVADYVHYEWRPQGKPPTHVENRWKNWPMRSRTKNLFLQPTNRTSDKPATVPTMFYNENSEKIILLSAIFLNSKTCCCWPEQLLFACWRNKKKLYNLLENVNCIFTVTYHFTEFNIIFPSSPPFFFAQGRLLNWAMDQKNLCSIFRIFAQIFFA